MKRHSEDKHDRPAKFALWPFDLVCLADAPVKMRDHMIQGQKKQDAKPKTDKSRKESKPPQMIGLLNRSDDTILSTLGSKSIAELTKVRRFCDRIWLRLLPSDSVSAECVRLGFDPAKLIYEKGPFSTEQNLEHIRLSGAKILLTKESGSIGGYPEKEKAAKIEQIRMITLRRPFETADGYDEADMKKLLLSMKEKHML